MAGTDDKDGEAKKLWFGGTLDDFKRASKLHDKVNLPCVSVLLLLTAYNFMNDTPEAAKLLTSGTILYIVWDIGYLVVVPACNADFGMFVSLIVHHLATLVLCLAAFRLEVTYLTKLCMIVELNTLCLTLKKVFKIGIMNTGHLATWLTLRLMWYPYLQFYFNGEFGHYGVMSLDYMQPCASLFVLNLLNWWWTYSLGKNFLGGGKKSGSPTETTGLLVELPKSGLESGKGAKKADNRKMSIAI